MFIKSIHYHYNLKKRLELLMKVSLSISPSKDKLLIDTFEFPPTLFSKSTCTLKFVKVRIFPMRMVGFLESWGAKGPDGAGGYGATSLPFPPLPSVDAPHEAPSCLILAFSLRIKWAQDSADQTYRFKWDRNNGSVSLLNTLDLAQ